MTHDEAFRIARKLADAFPVPAWEEAQIDLWVECLEDLDRDACAAVVLDLIRSRENDHRPTIGAIRQAVARRQAAPLGWLPVEDAWHQVLGRIATIGRYRDFATATCAGFPDPPPPFLARIVERLGWQQLCDTSADDLGTVTLGLFRRLYADALARTVADAAARPGAIPDPAASSPTALPPPASAEPRRIDGPTPLKRLIGGKALFSQQADALAGKELVWSRGRKP